MTYRCVKWLLLASSAFGIISSATLEAQAGGFALREQSVYGQGSSFAGVAAGGALSSMFWNPATMTQAPGITVEGDIFGILPYSSHTALAGSTLLALGNAGNSGKSALVPAAYGAWQVTPNLWVGMSFNAPFGLSVGFPGLWAGRNYAQDTSLKTYNATPSLAWRINDMISVGFGVQIQYGDADLNSGLVIPPATFLTTNINGNGWGWGITAGVTLTPAPGTQIGLGWRSQMDQNISGTFTVPAPLAAISTPGAVKTTLRLPDTVSLGIRQKLGPQWTVMGTLEWTNWSRIGTSAVTTAAGGPALLAGAPVTIPFQYSDGWFGSIGAEYAWNPMFALRAGIGWEKSPITDGVRSPRLPDNDRLWLSLGATASVSRNLKIDVAYSHLFVRGTPVNVVPGNPNFSAALGTYVGTVDSHVDIFSVALRYSFWEPPPAPRLPTK